VVWYACNGVAVHAVSRAPLNKSLELIVVATHSASSKVVHWDTPFADKPFPSVTPIFGAEGDGLTVVVMPHGLRQYPGYKVYFANAALVMSYEETNAPADPEWISAGGHNLKPSAPYKWEESPLLVRNRKLGRKAVFEAASIQHYVIAGGDWIVEVLAPSEPVITRFNKLHSISVNYAF